MSRLEKEPQAKKINWGKVVPAEGYLNPTGISIAIDSLFPEKFPSRLTLSNLANKILHLWEEIDGQDYSENSEKHAWALRYAQAVQDKIKELKRIQKEERKDSSAPSVETTRTETVAKAKNTIS